MVTDYRIIQLKVQFKSVAESVSVSDKKVSAFTLLLVPCPLLAASSQIHYSGTINAQHRKTISIHSFFSHIPWPGSGAESIIEIGSDSWAWFCSDSEWRAPGPLLVQCIRFKWFPSTIYTLCKKLVSEVSNTWTTAPWRLNTR